MAKIKFFPYNLLSESGVSVSVTGDADSGYPESRLYDRSIDFYWKYTTGGTITFQVDQGAAGDLAVDFLAIERHNFNGLAMTWDWSTNGSSWTNVESWTQSGNTQIIKTISSPLTKRYWRVVATSAVAPQCTEIYMSAGYEYQVVFDNVPIGKDQDFVEWQATYGGLEISSKRSPKKRTRSYHLFHANTVFTLSSFRELLSYLDDYSKPFYFKDHEGDYWLARFSPIPDENYTTEGTAETQVQLLEML